MSNWKAIVGKIAPVLGTALGGPLGGLAGTAISNALGLKGDASDDEKLAALQNPDMLLKLKQADMDFKSKMADLGIKEEDIAMQDRDSARKREAAIKDSTPKILAYGITLGFFGILAFMMKFDIPTVNKTELDVVLGSLGTAWIAVVTYYFGSSAGSRAKDDTIQKLSN